ncbi:reverse transcriptase [Carboxydothermus pertinax]|uniref:Reverse transcriptase n=1 Tax=Carboxydothermus pertinax TaxID=870242 RepID=A0A1L8CXE0_9THEO|nr:reverse transcriptase [Carboxydothermus pertinax]
METKLAKIAQVAKERPKEQFTSLAHLISLDMLLKCHRELSSNKAPGIDAITKARYEEKSRKTSRDFMKG